MIVMYSMASCLNKFFHPSFGHFCALGFSLIALDHRPVCKETCSVFFLGKNFEFSTLIRFLLEDQSALPSACVPTDFQNLSSLLEWLNNEHFVLVYGRGGS